MNNDAKTVWILSLITAIIGTVLAVPVIGSTLDFYSIPKIVTAILAIIILIKAKDLPVKKAGPVLTIISVILGIIGSIIIGLVMRAAMKELISTGINNVDPSTLSEEQLLELLGPTLGSGLAGGFLGVAFVFPSWILLIIATVFHYINFTKVRKYAEDLEYDYYNAPVEPFNPGAGPIIKPMNDVITDNTTVILEDMNALKDKEEE